jgi:hypothetical protein
MKVSGLMGFGLVLALAGTPALAFQEQEVGGGASQTQAPAAEPQTKAPDANYAAPEAPKDTGGTEVRIPGLGKLGELPKMDFGLELLYGANEGKQPVTEQPLNDRDDDLMIRGTVKHNF